MTFDLIHDGDFTPALSAGDIDPLEAMAADDRADWTLLVMVSCCGIATLVLAAASSFIA